MTKNELRRSGIKSRSLVVLIVAVSATAYALVGITSWKFSVVGDEWTFLDVARSVAEHWFLVNPLDRAAGPGNGLHPLLVSYLQALLMCFFGFDLTGLRISSVVMILPSLIVLYRFSRVLVGHNAAIFAVVLMAPSKYLVNFFKIGYGHSICFFLFLLCLHLATRLLRSPARQNAIDLGMALGFAFYIFIGPLFVLFIAPILFAAVGRNKKSGVRAIAVAGLLFACIAALGFLTTQPEGWFGGLDKTPLKSGFPSLEAEILGIGRYFLLFFSNFDYFYDHYVAGPYLDFVSRWLAVIGILVCSIRIRHRKGLLICLWCVVCVVLGVTNPYPWTPSTRGIFLVPLGALFAGVGLEATRRALPRKAAPLVVGYVLVAAVALNVYEAQVGVFQETEHSRTALIMRELRRPNAEEQRILVFHSEAFKFRDYHVRRLMSEFAMPSARLTISREAVAACSTDRETVIAFDADREGLADLRLTCPDLASSKQLLVLDGRYP